MGQQSMLRMNLNFAQVQRLVQDVAKTLDAEIGKGAASERLIDHMAGSTLLFLIDETHQWTYTLYQSYLVDKREAVSRGIYDPGGLVRQIYVDPSVVNPEGDKPAQYASVEFDRGGTHDTFDWVSAFFEGYFDEGMELFEAELGKKLGF